MPATAKAREPALATTTDNGIVIDLFCGIGGLSHGLLKEGFDIAAGIDSDETCRYGYEHSNDAQFIHRDIADLSCDDIRGLFAAAGGGTTILAACPPCQPWSNLKQSSPDSDDLAPLKKLACLIEEVEPDFVVMENVRGIADYTKHPAFRIILESMVLKYHIHCEIVNMADYGIPQNRIRLVLQASRSGRISLIDPTHPRHQNTVRDTISGLEPLAAGAASTSDPLHRAAGLSPLNLRRIRATPHDGGSATDWPAGLFTDCYRKKSGRNYMRSVYGRMRWDSPSPTITTRCTKLSTGRFGHPEQDRAISLREAALLQTFPMSYSFTAPEDPIAIARTARHIGNAVPVEFARVLARSIRRHIEAMRNGSD